MFRLARTTLINGLSRGQLIKSQPLATNTLSASFKRFQSAQAVTLNIKHGVAVIKLDVPNERVNSLTEQVTLETKRIYNQVQTDPEIKAAVIISGKPSSWIAGADIRILKSCKTADDAIKLSKQGQEFFDQIERSQKPIVAAIMGQCLGGGLELALSTHWRIAIKDKSTKLGLPEVMLGLLPGASGTQRLPRLVQITEALPMMLTGKQLSAERAKRIGLVDQLINPLGPGLKTPEENTLEYLEEVAVDVAKQLASGKLKPNRKRPLVERLTRAILGFKYIQDNLVFKKAREQVLKQTNGLYPAPLRILDVVKIGLQQGPVAGKDAESRAFGELAMTNESKGLLGLFDGITHSKKNRFGKPSKQVKNIGILGSGLMGAGIAAVSIDKGYRVAMKDMNDKGLARGYNQIDEIFTKKAKRRSISQHEKDVIMSRLNCTLNYDQLCDSDIVVEAVFEDINLKHKVVKEVEAVTRKDCIFASNTSALPINRIAEASTRPENVVGMHYFSPVDKMQLLEIITTDKTSPEATKTAVDVGLKQGKYVIVVKDKPGFYTTRILSFSLAEAFLVLQETCDPRRLDRVMKAYGWPVGSATLIDEVGLDIGAHIGAYLSGVYKERIVGGSWAIGQEMIDKGFFGRKSGKGWYLYSGKKGGKGARELNPQAIEILSRYKLEPKLISDEDIQQRLSFRFVNEAVLCLEEGVLDNPLEGDIGSVFGLGFPPQTGGVFRFVDSFGADRIVDNMMRYRDAYGSQFEPCQLLKDHAKDSSKRFYKS